MRPLPCRLALHAACGGGRAPGATVRADSAGVEIVVGPARDRVLTWRFERERVLGGAPDGPESFYRVRQGLVEADDDGNLCILDATNARVVSFDSTGRMRWMAGGEGGGPGEFRDAHTLSLGADGVVHVHDLIKGALVRFGPDGAVLPQVAFPFPPIPAGSADRARAGRRARRTRPGALRRLRRAAGQTAAHRRRGHGGPLYPRASALEDRTLSELRDELDAAHAVRTPGPLDAPGEPHRGRDRRRLRRGVL
jgi:hypothetical protein|nr:MAG: hypothetical protein DIU52_03145 [bacterium]